MKKSFRIEFDVEFETDQPQLYLKSDMRDFIKESFNPSMFGEDNKIKNLKVKSIGE